MLSPVFLAIVLAAVPLAPRHWAFVAPRPIPIPASLARHPIDAFLGDTPTAADKRVLIRRATFDLTGLPPTPAEVDAFVNDGSPGAFATMVDRLLASSAYGEKWGRMWLDVVRYADTAGETADFPAPEAFRYRNYIIDAFNADKPYDRFLREQLAGDMLPATSERQYREQVIATGFLAISRRFGYDIEKDHYLTIEDTIDTLGKSVLGLTLACARCHDHKYDPITHRDYYALYGIFDSTRYPFPGCEKTRTPRDAVPLLLPGEYERRLGEHRSRVKFASERVRWFDAASMRAWQQAAKQLDEFPASVPWGYAVAEGKPHHVPIQKRGDPEAPGDVVPRGMPAFLRGQTVKSAAIGSGRLELADWLTDPKHPLTARVMVNRIWQGHFGVGLVTTPNDFGTRSQPPTQPQLLDWLALTFIDSGWSIKTMHRLMMTSAAYKRADGMRRRLSGEEVRDSLLAVSGELDRVPGEAHPFPPAKSWSFTQHNPFIAVYDHHKRSVYLMTQRIKRHPFLALFDGPDPNASTAKRETTTVPTQALYFLNDPFVHARAAALAKRLAAIPEAERMQRACELLYGRAPRADELEAARAFTTNGDWSGWLRVMLAANEFVYVD